jgi:MFS family permease
VHAAVGGLPPAFWTLWSGMLVNRTASFVSTFLGLYLTSARGMTAAEAGRIVAFFGVGVLAAGPLGGVLADGIGRRATMVLGLAVGGAGVATLAFVREPGALAAATFVGALFGEMYRPAAQAVVADVVPLRDRARAYGLVYWAVNMGFTIGVLLAGTLAETSWVALFLTDAATSAVFAVLVLARLPETRPTGDDENAGLRGLMALARDRDLLVLLLLHFFALVVFTQFQVALPLDMRAHGLSPRTYALLVSINGIVIILLQPVIGARLRRFDSGYLLAASVALFGLGFGLNAVVDRPAGYALGVLLWTLGEILGFPAVAAEVAALAPPSMRGRYQGSFTMALGLALATASVVGGEVLTRFGGPTLWVGSLVLCALVSAGHLLAAPARRRRVHAMQARHAA